MKGEFGVEEGVIIACIILLFVKGKVVANDDDDDDGRKEAAGVDVDDDDDDDDSNDDDDNDDEGKKTLSATLLSTFDAWEELIDTSKDVRECHLIKQELERLLQVAKTKKNSLAIRCRRGR